MTGVNAQTSHKPDQSKAMVGTTLPPIIGKRTNTTLAGQSGNAATSIQPVSADSSSTKPNVINQETLYWYDGARKRMLTIDTATLADFGDVTARKAAPQLLDTTKLAGKSTDQAGVSPMFLDAGSGRTAGALPGGVLVRTKNPVTQDNIDALAAAFDATVSRAIGSAKGDASHDFWLLEAPSGTATLELANRIHESGQVKSAAPNWWKPRTLK